MGSPRSNSPRRERECEFELIRRRRTARIAREERLSHVVHALPGMHDDFPGL